MSNILLVIRKFALNLDKSDILLLGKDLIYLTLPKQQNFLMFQNGKHLQTTILSWLKSCYFSDRVEIFLEKQTQIIAIPRVLSDGLSEANNVDQT